MHFTIAIPEGLSVLYQGQNDHHEMPNIFYLVQKDVLVPKAPWGASLWIGSTAWREETDIGLVSQAAVPFQFSLLPKVNFSHREEIVELVQE